MSLQPGSDRAVTLRVRAVATSG